MSYDLETTTTNRYQTTTVATNTLIRNVYTWMCTALLLTGGTATLVANTPSIAEAVLNNNVLFWGLLIAQLGVVWVMSARVNQFSLRTLSTLFMLYSVLTGITFSIYFFIFTAESIASTFFITAGTFGAMSLYGYFTKTDLTKIGNLCIMVLVGIIIASVVNFFLKSETLYWVVTYIGVAVFIGLIAWDTQKIKALARMDDNEHTQKWAILGALTLYLDFINLFIMLLRILGKRR